MASTDLGVYMLIAIVAMAICMMITPVLIRYAPVLGMLDSPGDRKVHLEAIPRVGGIGIVLGLMVPLFIWLPIDPFVGSFLFGCSVLLIFGTWDDVKEIGPYIKLSGQFLAAISVVYIGDVYVYHFPFLGLNELPAYVGKPFTVFAIVGVINALNLSDGLDGLAGGEALLSLAAIAYMAYQFNGDTSIIIAAATIGGIFGFLRFNSHPAKVFMGDSGSQTLGFVLGVQVVYLSQNVNPVISPAIPALLLGIPVIDSLVVFYMRARRGDSLVVAAKDHLHHRLMELGFYHYESVVLIYSLQILFVVCAIIMPYESDILIMGVYVSVCTLLFLSLSIAQKSGLTIHGAADSKSLTLSKVIRRYKLLSVLPFRVVESGLSLFLIVAAITTTSIPEDFAISSAVLLLLLIIVLITGWLGLTIYRLIMFVVIGFSVYLLTTYPPLWLLDQIHLAYIFFLLMTLATFVAVRLSVTEQFQISPLDYLVVLIAIIVGVGPVIENESSSVIWMSIQIIILFYACELAIQNMKSRVNLMSLSAILTLVLIFATGYM